MNRMGYPRPRGRFRRTRVRVSSLLVPVMDAVSEAADMLVRESRRPDGPRGAGDKADIDVEIENHLAMRLMAILPVRFVGEETPIRTGDESSYCWLVDPHDGTWAWLHGYRGSSISVALLDDGLPVLGVVCAPMSPDRGRDLIAWAEGYANLLRNGADISVDLASDELDGRALVFVDHTASARPVAWGCAVAPARFIALPGIAYRLARVAAGDGVATLSLGGPRGIDYAAGHALLRGAGGVLLNESGMEVVYSRDGASHVRRCFAGAPAAARELATRSWPPKRYEEPSRVRVGLTWPATVSDAVLDRSRGCLFGQLVGDNLGALVEFMNESEIRQRHPGGVRELEDGGCWNILAGQATDDSELALALARTLVRNGCHDEEAVAAAYGAWLRSGPFDCGNTTAQALGPASRASEGMKSAAARSSAGMESQANGSLMRIAPIGIWARNPGLADRIARDDSRLTHPHPVCVDACGVLAAAIAEGLRSGNRGAMINVARAHCATQEIADCLDDASAGAWPEVFDSHAMGWVLIAFLNAFCHLARGDTIEETLVTTVARGGDTDTNAAIAGALTGAVDGLRSFPRRWVLPVMACRPHRALGAARPRPMIYWPDDLADLAEALVIARQEGSRQNVT